MAYTINQLKDGLHNATLIALCFPKIDTLVFRRNLASIGKKEREQLLVLSKAYLGCHPVLKQMIKYAIDTSEFSSSYYHNAPRKFRGAYNKCVYQTFSGMMSATI